MKHPLFILSLFAFTHLSAQKLSHFDGRWCFIGSRIIKFTEKSGRLYLSAIKDHDTLHFRQFYNNETITNPALLFPVTTSKAGGKLLMRVTLKGEIEDWTGTLIYNPSNDSTLYFTGNVYYDTSQVTFTNLNCDTVVPTCANYFYRKNDIDKIKNLRDLNTISREDAFTILRRFEVLTKQLCNRCYEGFPGANINRIAITMGYNPVTRRKWNQGFVFETSVFDFIVDKFVGRDETPRDKELREFYEKILRDFIGKTDVD